MSHYNTNCVDNIKIVEPQCKGKIKAVEEYLKAIDSIYKKILGRNPDR